MFWKKKVFDIEQLRVVDISKLHDRKRYTIAIIDDEDFPFIDALKKSDFIITKFNDIDSIHEIKGFDIIICDIRGVGKTFDPKYAGAHLIKEISNKYPQKFLIIHSGSTFKVDYNQFFSLADKNVKKGTNLTEWIDILDDAIRNLSNPVNQWEKTRKALKQHNISSSTISEIERAFIKSILNKDSIVFEKVLSKNKTILSNEYVAFILNTLSSFATSVISNLIMSK